MPNPYPTSTTVKRMDDTANLRANQSTPPSQIPSGRGGAGAPIGGTSIAGATQKPSQMPSGRGASGKPVGGTSIGPTAPVQLPSGRSPSASKANGLTPSDVKAPPSRIPGK